MLKFITILLSVSNLVLFAQLSNRTNNKAIENGSVQNYKASNITYGYSSVLDTSRRVPGLTSWWDYWTNGNNQRKVVVLGDTVIVTHEYSDSTNAQVSTGRKLFYQFSFNGGVTWQTDPVLWTTAGNAYPDLWPVFLGGNRTIVISGRQFAGGSRGYTGIDVVLGAGSVTSTLIPVVGSDYFSWIIGGNQVAGCYQSGDSLFFRRFNYQTNTYDARQLIAVPPTEIAANGRKMIAASSDGQRIFVMWYVSTTGSESLVGRLSTDGGNTFGAIQTIMQNGYTIGPDHMLPWFGDDVLFKPNSTNYGVAFNTQPISSIREYKVLYWSPSVNGGNAVKIADWTNTPYLADTMWVFNQSASNLIQVGMTYVSHPSLAYSTNGSRLFCVFSCAQKDSIFYPSASQSFMFNDLFCSYSDNDGATWSAPVRITNTPDQDEIYPVLSKYGNTPGNFGLVYELSAFPGSSSFSQTTCPVSLNYFIYTRVDPVTGNQLPIGVNTISTEVPKSFSLEQNYPNPFNPSTKIRFNIVSKSVVTLKVYNLLGEVVSVLINNENINPGTHEMTFNGDNNASGVYFYTLTAGNFTETKKMILVK